jgi:hypothetical protein
MNELIEQLETALTREYETFLDADDRDYHAGRISGLEEARQLVLRAVTPLKARHA